MIALFIIAFVLLAATAYTFYRRQHASSDYHAQLGTKIPPPRSLFDDREAHAEHQLFIAAQARTELEASQASLLKRAAGGDLTTLAEAHRAADPALYGSVSDGLLEWASNSEANLRSLASFVADNPDLRGGVPLAAAYTNLWRANPDRRGIARMLHLAARSDDADTFECAVVAAIDAAGAGRLQEIERGELSTLIESEYWVLSSAARSTGAGFVLKQRLAALRDSPATSQRTESPDVES